MHLDSRTTDLNEYLDAHATADDPELLEVIRHTVQSTVHPRMIAGAQVATFLEILIKTLNPRTILEIGTFTGYTTLRMARAAAEEAIVHTIEVDPKHAQLAKGHFQTISTRAKIMLHQGDASQIIPTLDGSLGLIFMDADKRQYLEYLQMLTPKMPSGALLIADNVLWSGEVLNPDTNDPQTIALQQFNNHIHASPLFDSCIIPIRDGLLMGRKR